MWLAWTRSWITDGSTGPPVGGAPEVACTFILLFHEKYLTGRAYPKDAAEGKPLGARALAPPADTRARYIVPLGRRRERFGPPMQILSVAMWAGLRHSCGDSSATGRDWGTWAGGHLCMPSLDFAMGTFALPAWAAGAAAALFIVIGVLTLTRAGASLAGTLVRLLAVVICLAAVWLFLDRTESHERSAERRALDQRAADLTARALTAG